MAGPTAQPFRVTCLLLGLWRRRGELRRGSPPRGRCAVGPEGRERLPRLLLKEEIADVTPSLRAVALLRGRGGMNRKFGPGPAFLCSGDAHFLSGTETCCLPLLHAQCHTFRFRIRPAPGRFAQAHFPVPHKWPQVGSMVVAPGISWHDPSTSAALLRVRAEEKSCRTS